MPMHPVDIHVGSRVRLRRNLQGVSQTDLGETVGLTFQQIQKYENGKNRISASKLFQLSQALDVPVSFFFDDMPRQTCEGRALPAALDDPMAKREVLELVRAYYRIEKRAVRKQLFELAKVMGAEG